MKKINNVIAVEEDSDSSYEYYDEEVINVKERKTGLPDRQNLGDCQLEAISECSERSELYSIR